MSDRVLPPREGITIVRSQSNGLRSTQPFSPGSYLIGGLIALGAVGLGYWMFASYPRPGFTMTSVMSAPTAGPGATSGDMQAPPPVSIPPSH